MTRLFAGRPRAGRTDLSFEQDRRLIRALHRKSDCPTPRCRDPQHHASRVRAPRSKGSVCTGPFRSTSGLPGVGSTYEVPERPDLVLGSGSGSMSEQVSIVLELAETLFR